jgi:hypothetical protein
VRGTRREHALAGTRDDNSILISIDVWEASIGEPFLDL